MKLINIFDNLYVKMDKAKATHKYYKRVPKPTGKGYIYFYTKEQYQASKKEDKKGLFSGIMSFFGFKDDKQAKEKVTEIYTANRSELSGIDKSTFSDYLNEYLSNKEKWDKKFQAKPKVVGTKDGKKVVKKPAGEKKATGKKGFSLSIMKKVAGVVGGVGEKNKEGFDPNAPEKFSKDYEKFANDVLNDVKKNKDLADYYLERTQKDIKQSERRINSIKKEAQKNGEDPTDAIALFRERIKDASILNKQIKEITGEYPSDSKDNFATMPEGEGKKSVTEQNNENLEKRFKKYSTKELQKMEDELDAKGADISTKDGENLQDINSEIYRRSQEKPSDKREIMSGEGEKEKKTKKDITGEGYWNGKIYGRQGKFSIYVGGEKKEISNEDAKILDPGLEIKGGIVSKEQKPEIRMMYQPTKKQEEKWSKMEEKPLPSDEKIKERWKKSHRGKERGWGMLKRQLKSQQLQDTREYQVGLWQGKLDRVNGVEYSEERNDNTFNLGYYRGWNENVNGYIDDVKKVNPNFSHLNENMKKASILKINGKYYRMEKGKKVPPGSISKDGKKKKSADGTWVPIGKDKPTGKPGEKPKPDGKPEDKKKKKEPVSDENSVKERVKTALKKMANILAEALSGKDVVQPTGSAVEQAGEDIKRKKKPKEKPKADKPKEGKK